MYEQNYTFSFEAAHELGANVAEPGHPYANIHGHSFEVTVTLARDDLGAQGWVMDFAKLRAACDGVRATLDHSFLNGIEGLERPTLETLSRWIFDRLSPEVPALVAVEVARPTLKERCCYRASARY